MIAERVRRDTDALFQAVGGDSPLWRDEILMLYDLKVYAERAWGQLLRRDPARWETELVTVIPDSRSSPAGR